MLAPEKPRSSSNARIVLLLTTLAFALRVYRLGASELWFDEAASYFIAQRDIAAIFDYLRAATGEHPPFYYLLLHGWMQFAGASEFALRYLSLAFGVLFVPLLYRFARREFGEGIGLGAATAAALSPFMFVYSQEARMYTLLPLLGLLAMDLFVRAVRAGRARHWALFALVSLLGMATHYYFGLTFIAESLFIALCWRSLPRRVWLTWGAVMVVVVSALFAWLWLTPGLLATLQNESGTAFNVPWYGRLTRVARDMFWGEPFGLDPNLLMQLVPLLAWLPVWMGVRASSAVRGGGRDGRESGSSDHGYGRALLLTFTAGALIGVGLLPQSVVGRQAAVMEPAFLVLLVLGLAELNRRGTVRGALALALMLILFVVGIQNQFSADKGDWGASLAQLAREAQPGDAIVLAQPSHWPLVAYYQRRPDVTVYYMVEQGGPLTEEQAVRFMQDVRSRHSRIWVGPTGANTTDPDQLIPQWLRYNLFAELAHYHRSISFTLFVDGRLETVRKNDLGQFGDRIHLNMALLNAEQVKPGETLLLELRWESDTRLSADDVVVLQLSDAHGTIWGEHRLLPCGGICLTTDWLARQTIEDRHAFTIPPGTPSGDYRLLLELYDPSRRGLLPVRGGQNALELARVQVVPDPQAVVPRIAQPLAVRFGSGLRLLGLSELPSVARSGEAWPMDVLWGADAAMSENSVAVFQWLNARDQVVAEIPLPIGTDTYPSFVWQPGEIIRQHYDLPVPRTSLTELQLAVQVRDINTAQTLPPSLPNGDRSSRVRRDALLTTAWPQAQAATTTDTGAAWAVANLPRVKLATVPVRQTERRFIAPDVSHALDAHFADQFALIGYQIAQPSPSKLDVMLHWRGMDPTRMNYKVFVHVLGDDDRVLAQHDSQPANGLRPTSDWMSGEFVTDEHQLTLNGVPPGTYRVEVGLYDPTSGARLPVFVQHVPQPDDRILLPSVRVP